MGKGGKKGVWKNSGPHVLVFPSSLGIGGGGPGMVEPSGRVWGSLWTCTGDMLQTRRSPSGCRPNRDLSKNTEEAEGGGTEKNLRV